MDNLKKLYDIGFALHWLHPNSKVPVKKGWSDGPRLPWDKFISLYQKNYNVGVRLGLASKIGDKYLAVIDVDVKGTEFCDEENALAALYANYPQAKSAPSVLSGRGGGSRHFYVLLDSPYKGDLKIQSEEVCECYMPSAQPSKRDRENLGEERVKAGFRIRPSWEVSLMSEGRQVVLPPSIHPDSREVYTWERELTEARQLPRIEPHKPAGEAGKNAPSKAQAGAEKAQRKAYVFEEVDLTTLELRDDQIAAIETGEGVEDRSAMCLSIALALLNRRVDEDTIISILTDRSFFLGETAYDHAKTQDRRRAAYWIDRYILGKAKSIREEEEQARLAIFEVESDDPEFGSEIPEWAKTLEYTANKPRRLKSCFKNVKLILENVVGQDLIGRNQFTHDDVFLRDMPGWGFKKGKKLSGNDDDFITIKDWFTFTYSFEPDLGKIREAMTRIALKNSFHPVKEFLESLEWDGVPRIETAFKRYMNATAPEPYLSDVSRKFFTALMKRIYEPGCKMDHLPVLEGEQGKGKSSFGAILVGLDWYMDGLPDLKDKDSALNLQGIWLCEMSELSSLYQSQLETAKAFISRPVDKLRPPYGHRRQDYPRASVFIGTTNESDYLRDQTGNRRYWPIPVAGCDFEGLMNDRLQLLAEAKAWYDFGGENLWLEGKAKEQAEILQSERRLEDDTDDMNRDFRAWVARSAEEKIDIQVLNLKDLFDDGPFLNYGKTAGTRMAAARVLRRNSYAKRHTKQGNRWVKGAAQRSSL